MIRRSGRRFALALTLSTALAACTAGGGDDDDDGGSACTLGDYCLFTSLANTAAPAFVGNSAALAVQGLYFGELEVVAYDYRPGESVQNHSGAGGFVGADWSYWVVLQSGHEAARDNLLETSGTLDVDTWNGPYFNEPDAAFVAAAGAFDIDLFEVNAYRTGVISSGGVFYGMNADLNGLGTHPLWKYPAWDGIEDHFTMPFFPGFPSVTQDMSVVLARSDWFATPVLVTFAGGPPALIDWSSRPLVGNEQAILESMVQQGTSRRFYDALSIVPIDGPITIALTTDTATNPSEGTYAANDLRVRIGFDLSSLLDPATDYGIPEVHYNGVNGVPFGLSVDFEDLPDPP